jgi:hypothetical protein
MDLHQRQSVDGQLDDFNKDALKLLWAATPTRIKLSRAHPS